MVLEGPISADKGPAAILNAAAADDGGTLTVPGGEFLLHADYVRHGSDLVLVKHDDAGVLIAGVLIVDFFAVPQTPVLQSDSGLRIPPEVAAKLAGPVAPGQFAQAAPAVASAPVAKVETVDGEGVAVRADGTRVVLAAGSAIFEGDVLETGAGAALGLIYIDGMTMALDQNTRMIVDQVFYNASANQGKALFSLVEGAFLSLSGKIATLGEDVVTFRTPTGDIGIRGTNQGTSHLLGITQVVLFPNPDGTVGTLIFFNDGGFTILDGPYEGLRSTSFDLAPSEPTAFGSLAESLASLGISSQAVQVFQQTITQSYDPEVGEQPAGNAPNITPEAETAVIIQSTDLGGGLGTDILVGGVDDPLAGSGAIIIPLLPPSPSPSPSPSPLPPPAIKPPVLIFEGFEEGIGSIDTFTLGSVTAVGPEFGIAPSEGSLQALLTPGADSATAAEIEAFFDLPAGALAIIADGVPIDGAAIKTVLDLNPGDTVTVTFNFNFLDVENPARFTTFDDFAFAVIGDDLILLDSVATANENALNPILTSIGAVETSANLDFTFAATFPSGGTVDLGVGVANVNDVAFDSGLLLDNVSILIEAAA